MKLICKKCKEDVRKVNIPRYENEKGVILEDVEAYECQKRGEFVFTEEQIEEVARRTEAIQVK